MHKVSLGDSLMSGIVKMSEGNPGATEFFTEVVTHDYVGGIPGVVMLMRLDELGIYGDKANTLWNDCCGRDMWVVETMLRNYQNDMITAREIQAHVEAGIPFQYLVPMEEMFPELMQEYFLGIDLASGKDMTAIHHF